MRNSLPKTRPTLFAALAALLFAAGCSQMPATGPTTREVTQVEKDIPLETGPVQLIDIDERVVSQLAASRRKQVFSEVFGSSPAAAQLIGSGDGVEVTIWEAPPATLFQPSNIDPRVSSATGAVTLPPQMVDRDGMINVPFAGRVRAAGLTPTAVAEEISRRLKDKANHPQAIVRVATNASSTVTVVGEVTNNTRMPLTASGERLLDAIAAAGGVRGPVNKVSVQMTRNGVNSAMPLDDVIRDPAQNVALHAGDVITAMVTPLVFTALGATARQTEVPFESQGVSLVQALGRVGGLIDSRSDPRGIFVFRFEPRDALAWPQQPVATNGGGMVPVVYKLDLRDPKSFFVMQNFSMRDRDVLYVSNAPLADLQKFLTIVYTMTRDVNYLDRISQ